MTKKLRLTTVEKAELLKAIEDARARLNEITTEEEGIALLRERLAPALYGILRNHRQERQLT